jgi:hypothetical protein
MAGPLGVSLTLLAPMIATVFFAKLDWRMAEFMSMNRWLMRLSLIVLALAPTAWGSGVVFCLAPNGHGVYESLFSWCCIPMGAKRSTGSVEHASITSTRSLPACAGCVDVSVGVTAAHQPSRSGDITLADSSSSNVPVLEAGAVSAALTHATDRICPGESGCFPAQSSKRAPVLRC